MATDDRTIAELLASLCDETISPEEMQRLDRLLCTDAAVRRQYMEYLDLHARLSCQFHHSAETMVPLPSMAVPLPPIVIQTDSDLSSFHPIGSFIFSYSLAAVIVGIGLLVGWACHIPGSQGLASNAVRPGPAVPRIESNMVFVGRIADMVDCRWADPSTEPFNGARVPLGRKYVLAAGLMEIVYDTGARVILQGPCSYEVKSGNSGYLTVGKLTARIERKGDAESRKTETSLTHNTSKNGEIAEQPSSLFSVRTPTAIVTDLGTEFGVECDKSGVTWSSVFRGSVKVQAASADGRPQESMQVLHENQSARVERVGNDAGGLKVVLGQPVVQGGFVRKMPRKTVKIFDLVDAMAGGDGFSGRRDRSINPTNGQPDNSTPIDAPPAKWLVGDWKYHRAVALSFVDGVFIPDGGNGPVQLDSAGHSFGEFPKTDNVSPGYIWAGGRVPTASRNNPAVLGNIDYSAPGHSNVFLHANAGITFDLDAIRRANPGCKVVRFRAVAGSSERDSTAEVWTSADLWVFVDGRVRFQRREINGLSGAFVVNIPIADGDRFLTLAATDAGNGVANDWILFGDARLELLSTETPVGSDSPHP